MFFLQMSGFPGSGKSTLAREIARQTRAIIIDHDIVKSALLESLEEKAAGQASYHIEWANARLKTRKRMISQIEEINSEEGFRYALESSKKPSDMKCLIVDSSQSVDCYINKVIEYIIKE